MVLSAGVIPVRETPEGYRFLLLRAYDYWDFPKGMVEPGETPEEAAVKETEEEAGVQGALLPGPPRRRNRRRPAK